MTTSEKRQEISELKDIAEAVSAQTKVENRAWLAVISVSFLVLLPNASTTVGGEPTIQLPFSLGSVAPSVFYPLGFAMLAILIVALASAHAQALRAQKLAQRIVETLASEWNSSTKHPHPRDLFDILRVPSLTRVAPLAQWVRGSYQFADKEGECPFGLRMASTAYYIVLKVVTMIVLFLFPGLALWYGYKRTASTGLSSVWLYLLASGGVVAAFSLIVAALSDLKFIWDVVLILSKNRATSSAEKGKSKNG